MKKNQWLEGLLILLVSGFFIMESIKLHRGNQWALSPALFPLIISISSFLLATVLIYQAVNTPRQEEVRKGNLKDVVFLAILSMAYLVILPRLGFLLSSIVYLFFFSLILGERRWWVLGLLSTLAPILIQYIFGNLLNVYFP